MMMLYLCFVVISETFQAMIIMACHDLGSPLEMLDAVIFEDIMSIFITSAILKLIQGIGTIWHKTNNTHVLQQYPMYLIGPCSLSYALYIEEVIEIQNMVFVAAILDIAFTWKIRLTMDILTKRKQVVKLVVAVIWTIVLPVYYAKSRRKYTCYSTQYRSWLGELCFSSYMVAVAIFLMTNAVEMVLFFVPVLHKYIEISTCQMFKVLSWWTQVQFNRGYEIHFDSFRVIIVRLVFLS